MLSKAKKAIALFTSACLAVTMTPVVNDVAYADTGYSTGVVQQYYNPNYYISCMIPDYQSKGISIDGDNGVITLDNVNISGNMSNAFSMHVNSQSNANVSNVITINLVGNNVINNTSDDAFDSIFDFTTGGFKVTGSGSLETSGIQFINASRDVNIESGMLNLKNVTNENGAIHSISGSVNVGSNAKISIEAKGEDDYGWTYAITADKMTNSYKSIGTIKGVLPKGAELANNNAIFKVNEKDDRYATDSNEGSMDKKFTNATVTLTKWVSGTHFKLTDRAMFNLMGTQYRINRVKANSFNNAAGAKLKKLTIKQNVPIKFEAKAFNGTTNLKDIYTAGEYERSNFYSRPLVSNGGEYFNRHGNSKVNNKSYKNFLKGAGKNKGKGLTIHVGQTRKWHDSWAKKHKIKWFVYAPNRNGYEFYNSPVEKVNWQSDVKKAAKKWGLSKTPKVKMDKAFWYGYGQINYNSYFKYWGKTYSNKTSLVKRSK